MRCTLPLAVISLFLAACAPLPIVDQSSFNDRVGHEPELGQQSKATTGGLMFSQYSYWNRSGARITESNRQAFGLGGLFISQGEIVYPASLDGKPVFCSDKRVYTDPIAGFLSKACFADSNKDGLFDMVQVAPENTWIARPLSPLLPYKKMDIPAPHRGSYKYEIAYDGYSNQTLHLSYREYRGKSLERPSYTQQVKYEVKVFPDILVFRNVNIEILNANNEEIQYKMIRGF